MKYTPIKRNNDFTRAYKKGKSYVHPGVVLYVNKNRAKKTRVGITASKKVGNAVMRNRARRIIRHALYEVLSQDIGGLDIILVARGKTPHMKSTDLVPIVQQLLLQAGLPISKGNKNEMAAD